MSAKYFFLGAQLRTRVWKSIDPIQVNFIAAELDEKYTFLGKEWWSRLAI